MPVPATTADSRATMRPLAWPALDRWSNLRDELNSFFEMPISSGFGRTSQLFTGWSPALDLYESGDHFVAVVELPGMRKEDIDISLHVPNELTSKFQANKLIQQIAPILGGKGGGRPESAQGAGKDATKVTEALGKARELLS